MKALVVQPGTAHSAAVRDVGEPPESDGPVLVETLTVGVCGTDREIVAGLYGQPPPGQDLLVLGHESLGRVLAAPHGSGLTVGDLVVGVVRRPDPVPCANCAAGEWDMCRNGRYTERGIKALHGFASERYRTSADYAVRVDPALRPVGVLLEPASVVAKAWEHIERIGRRAHWAPHRVLVTGAGPIGLLAALLGVQRGLAVHVLDRVVDGPKPSLVRDLGATYTTTPADELPDDFDVVIECTGVPSLVVDVMSRNAHNGVVCLTGVSPRGRSLAVDVGGLNRDVVLQNDVILGSVNANRRHYRAAGDALARADAGWLDRLITRRVPLGSFAEALAGGGDDIKVVLDINDGG